MKKLLEVAVCRKARYVSNLVNRNACKVTEKIIKHVLSFKGKWGPKTGKCIETTSQGRKKILRDGNKSICCEYYGVSLITDHI